MPRGDGSGPQGRGSMTGRGMGRCSGNNSFAAGNGRNQGSIFSFLGRMFSGSGRDSGGGRRGGIGQGMGYGMGQGRGMGRNQGIGRGMGMRQDAGRGIDNLYKPEGYGTDNARPFNPDTVLDEAAQLKEMAKQIEEELNAIQKKINNLESRKPASEQVRVDRDLCTGCGRCQDACACNAITVRAFAQIDHDKCTFCGRCVDECPANALRIA